MPLHRSRSLPAVLLTLVLFPSLPAEDIALADFQQAEGRAWQKRGDHLFADVTNGQPAGATFTVSRGGAGFYAVTDSQIRRDAAVAGRIELGLRVVHGGARGNQPSVPAVQTTLEGGELFDFDTFLGYLAEGDTVQLTVGPGGDGGAGDRAELDCRLTRTPFIPVSVFPADLAGNPALRAPGGWSLSSQVAAGTSAARRLSWGRATETGFEISSDAARVTPGPAGRESLAAFRVPQSGYYALHEAWLAAEGGEVEARLFVGDETAPRRVVRAVPGAGRAALDADIGYVAKGEVIWLALAGSGGRAAFAGTVVEWAPRRAPLRVVRGADGYLDVFEPQAPRRAVDVPAERWIAVPASDGDSTEAIRRALAQAADRAKGGGYAGVRLESGRTYTVASQLPRGRVFDLRGIERVVFDGNGATLHIGSDELARQELQLFHVIDCRNLVFADFTATGAAIPFTTGEILDVTPRGEKEMTQTVTFRVDPGELDPLKDIARNGRSNAYAYDPKIPGRLGVGTWTHYPGHGDPSIKATDTPGVFTHRVTRTNNSIEPGMKWLIKNKNAGVIYLETRGGRTENITLSGIEGRASGGGQLRFWQTSGINILGCRFEPDGDNWISSSADGVHGRGREGVWIEDTLIRGICEDIMNTYGQNMVVEADENPTDNMMSIRMFERSSNSPGGRALRMPADDNVAPGDQLVFFNPQTGRVLGYAGVTAINRGRFTLTNPVPEVDSWEEADGKNATMVYNTRVAGRFFLRDTRFMDSMRFGVYIKARGGVIFGSQFEGLSGPSVFATNEPEWPEGPPATHLWVQGCVFSQNNYGFMPRNRDFMVVDPADISVYTRHFRDPAVPDDHRAYITHGQYANSHVKLLGNVFRDWRGMGISVRNAKNVRIEGNRFLAPVHDDVMRGTLASDPALQANGRGGYAAIHLDSVGGVRVADNRFHHLPAGDRPLAQGAEVAGLVETGNAAAAAAGLTPVIALSFDEWFGDMGREAAGVGAVSDKAALGGATHRAGRLGAGLHFSGGAPAVIEASADTAIAQRPLTVGLWVRPESVEGSQTVLALGSVNIVLAGGRWRAGGMDLGAATAGFWEHL
ncbi:MAG TPA: right-handed parallel beta-helix repeat-containing protein, partial [Lacunisphaera sp.]|nr:right-handed parallel beta-helix repeat-containing protein [Lacunisphaera sp.]